MSSKPIQSLLVSGAGGDAVAVMGDNDVEFYAVPAILLEEMTAFCEYSQRRTTEQINVPAKFSGDDIDIDKLVDNIAKRIEEGPMGEFEEWPKKDCPWKSHRNKHAFSDL